MKHVDLNGAASDKVFALVYGGSGTGKTHLLGTLGKLGYTLICDVDRGSKTIRNAPDITQAMKDNIVIASFDLFKDLDKLYKMLLRNDPQEWSRVLQTTITKPFEWAAIDTWSELQWWMIQELRSKDDAMRGKGDLDFRQGIQIQHWGMMTDLNKLAVEKFRDLPLNMIFTMQEKLDKDDVTGQIYGGPAIHGKMVQEMPTYFDVVVRTETDLTGAFMATNKARGKWAGKTRLGVGNIYKNPTAEQLFTVSSK